MICADCKNQLGPNAMRHAHEHLLAHGEGDGQGFHVQRFQSLFSCSVCRATLSRGRNTGWSQAPALLVESHHPA